MSLLSTAQIEQMRATAERALPDVATIQRGTAVSDGGGGTTMTWMTLAEDVPCRLSPVSGGEVSLAGGRISDEATSIVTMAATRDITEADRLIIDGLVYEVQLVRRRGNWALTTRIECREAP